MLGCMDGENEMKGRAEGGEVTGGWRELEVDGDGWRELEVDGES